MKETPKSYKHNYEKISQHSNVKQKTENQVITVYLHVRNLWKSQSGRA